MSKTYAMLLFCFVVLFILGNAYADHPTVGFGSEVAGPIITVPASTLPKGTWSIGSRLEYTKFDAFSNSKLETLAENGNETHSLDYLLSSSLSIAHGFNDNLTLSLDIPYVRRHDIKEGHLDGATGEVHKHGNSKGIGDLSFLAQYRFLEDNDRNLQAAFLSGIKFPTGTTHDKDKGGARFEIEHQPGSGSWDPFVGIAISKELERTSFYSNILYTFAAEGVQDTVIGDSFDYNLALAYRLNNNIDNQNQTDTNHIHVGHTHTAWNLILELNGQWRQKQNVSGTTDKNSGGNIIFLSPGLRITLDDNWSMFASIGFPIVQDLNGKQPDTDFRLIVGTGWLF